MGLWCGVIMHCVITFVPHSEYIIYGLTGACCSLIVVTFYQLLEEVASTYRSRKKNERAIWEQGKEKLPMGVLKELE